MAKAGRKHKRQQRVVPNGEQAGVPIPESDDKKSRIAQLIQRAHDQAQAGELDDALRTCSEILNEDPFCPEALFISAYVLQKAERFGLADCIMERCSRIVPEKEQVWNNWGLIKVGLNDLEGAA